MNYINKSMINQPFKEFLNLLQKKFKLVGI
jgi:hypothetical protein